MFKYAENNLLSDERILHQAKFHWFVYIPGLLFFAMILFFPKEPLYVGVLTALGIASLVKSYFMIASTEFVVTTMRVIVKTGVISRNTIELNHRNIESVNFDQSVLGRIFGYGSLYIAGTGAGVSPIPWIDNPLEFRKQVLETVHHSRR